MSPILARLIGRQLRSVERGSFASRSLTSLSISKEEKQSRRLNQRSMQTSLEALHRDGIVIIEDAVNKSTIDALNERMEIDTRILIERGEQGPFNYNLGNLQQSPPFELSTFAPDIFVNPIATQLTSAYLGGRPTLSFISSNAAVKAEQGQPIHCDADFDHPKAPFAAVVNVGLVDMSPINGSTEIWPGSHYETTMACQVGKHGERASGRIRNDFLEARRKNNPPIQPSVSKGSIIIRDLRLWHAGMPNTTDKIRIMLAMIHFAPWYRQRMTMRLPRALRSILESSDQLNISADWRDSHIDHLESAYGNAFDFDQDCP